MRLRVWLSALTMVIFYTIYNAHAASISVSSSVENVSYDLGFMTLSLEKIASNMRISPTVEGKLLIEDVNAQRLVLTMVEDSASSGKGAGLPAKIHLPLAIRVKSASIAEVIIVNGEDRQTLTDVAFNLEADGERLQLELVNANTPWGVVSSNIDIKNAKPFPLDGHVKIAQEKASTPYVVDIKLAGDLKQLEFSTSSLLSKQEKQYALLLADTDIDPASHIARVILSGNLGLEDAMPLSMQAQLLSQNGDKSTQAAYHLDLSLSIQGSLSPQPNLMASLQAKDSVWQGEAIQLDASANLAGKVMQEIRLNATLKDNTLTANGSLGSTSEPLLWQAKLADISAFDSTLAGKLNAQGKFAQIDGLMHLTMDWLGERLIIANSLQIDKLSGKADISNKQDTPLNVDIKLEDASLQKSERFNALLTVRGNPAQHQIELKSTAADGTLNNNQLVVRLSGSKGVADGWLGTLNTLDYQGDKPVKLAKSASLQYDNQAGFQLKNLALQFTQGHLYIDQLQTGNGQFISKGRIASIGLQALPSLTLSLPSNIRGNPVFSGEWDIQAAEQANGHATLALESGDISIAAADGSIKPLGLRSFVAKLLIQNNNINLSGEVSGNTLGELSAKLNTQLSQTSTGLAISNDAPLDLSAKAELNTLLWLSMPESLADATMDGQIILNLEGSGSVGRPSLAGTVTGKQLSLLVPSEGVNLGNGILDANFSNDQLVIKQAKFQGGDGFLTATGSMQLARGEPELSLYWQAENFTAASRTDRLIVIAGEIDTKLSSNLLEVSGQVEIIRGLIELAGEDKPTLSDDVVIIGREIELAENPLLMKVTDLKIGIGNSGQFVLRGRGLDSTLVGRITLNGLPNQALRAEGTISAAGTYMAYGQVLKIERGQLNFSGPVDNPGLNILALRQNMAVRAGVEIRGNVLNPSIKLVSIPEVSDSDKLSWLVLGHGIDQAGQDQFAILSLAAGALLSQGQSVPLQTRFARAAGFDSFNIGGSDAQSTSVSLGKRLASNLYLTYEKEVTGLLNVARLTYDITNRWSIRTQAGSESAVDVLYTFSFK